ncbi:MAG: hypothetical protein ACW964_19670 [Candidatus Hodarchaeales archaeon]|jgi:hypothetical protein
MNSGFFEIRDVIDMDLEGGTLIECFPSISALALNGLQAKITLYSLIRLL